MEIKVFQTTPQDDGSWEVGVSVFNDLGKELIRTTINALNIEDLKGKFRTYKEKFEAMENQKDNMIALAQAAIDEVMAEV